MKLFFSIIAISIMVPQIHGATNAVIAHPNVQWKYGYKDGTKANTIGSAKNTNLSPSAAPAVSTGYTPAQLAHAYGFDQIPATNTGAGATIAVVVAYGSPTIQSDLNTFCLKYNIPTTAIRIYYPTGVPYAKSWGWAAETTLDVEWSHAMSPAATIALVVAPDASIGSLLSAVTYANKTLNATVVSMSWGAGEFSGCASLDTAFQGPTLYTASSGDSGAGVEWPACSKNVVSVGGTSLGISAATGSIATETGWSGSGGGVSQYEPKPAYQATMTNASGRSVPDVSYVADPYTGVSVYFTDPILNTGGWYVFGGTSAGAPQWAALLARKAPLNFSTALYTAATTNYATILHDITSGSNGKYTSSIGYDYVTGLGSPVAQQIAGIKNVPPPQPTPPPSPSPNSGALHGSQLYAAWLLIMDLNQSLTMDTYARNPGVAAFLFDGTKMINYQTARDEMNAGTTITAVFYEKLTDSSLFPVNILTWQTMQYLSYSQMPLKVQTSTGAFSLYQLNMN